MPQQEAEGGEEGEEEARRTEPVRSPRRAKRGFEEEEFEADEDLLLVDV
jgi:hypothetical protein